MKTMNCTYMSNLNLMKKIQEKILIYEASMTCKYLF